MESAPLTSVGAVAPKTWANGATIHPVTALTLSHCHKPE
jgi:hypothetical protein